MHSLLNYLRGICYGSGTFVAVSPLTKVILQSGYLEAVPPSIGIQPKSVAIYEGGTARFTVTAFGTPPLSYQWRHEGMPVSGATTASLMITNAVLGNSGSYDVIVSNLAGTAFSRPAVLNVSWLSIASFAGLRLQGQVGSSIRIEYIENVDNNNWLFLTNIVLPANPYIWIDYDSPNSSRRFYQAERQ